MNLSLQPIIIDIIVTFVILFMIVIGYSKGFVVRIYDLMASLVALGLSLFMSGPLSEIFVLYKVEGFAKIIGVFINRLLVFVLLFIVLKIALRLLGIIVKPILKALVSKIGFIQKCDRILGVVFGVLEGCLLLYIALIMVITPIFSNGKEIIEETMIAKQVLHIVPPVTEAVMEITDNFMDISGKLEQGMNYQSLSGESIGSVSVLVNNLYKSDVLSKESALESIQDYFSGLEDIDKKVELTPEQYQQLQTMLDNFLDTEIDKDKIYQKITVSE